MVWEIAGDGNSPRVGHLQLPPEAVDFVCQDSVLTLELADAYHWHREFENLILGESERRLQFEYGLLQLGRVIYC